MIWPYPTTAGYARACIWFERTGLEAAIEALGSEHIVFETDYPHPTCTYPNGLELAAEALAGIEDPQVRRNLMGDNAARLYHLDRGRFDHRDRINLRHEGFRQEGQPRPRSGWDGVRPFQARTIRLRTRPGDRTRSPGHPGQHRPSDQRHHRNAAQRSDVPGVPARPRTSHPRGRGTRVHGAAGDEDSLRRARGHQQCRCCGWPPTKHGP